MGRVSATCPNKASNNLGGYMTYYDYLDFSFSVPADATNVSATLTATWSYGYNNQEMYPASSYISDNGNRIWQSAGPNPSTQSVSASCSVSAGDTSKRLYFEFNSGMAHGTSTIYVNLKNITLTITWTDPQTSHTITINNTTGGTATASKIVANYGDQITLTATPSTGYSFKSWSASPTVTITNNKFTMPNADITITPAWTHIQYSVTIASATGGTATASKSTAYYGDQITLTASPSTGYSFASWSSSPSVTISGGSFSMPAGNITITPVFTRNQYSITIASATGGTATASKSTAYYGDQITLTASPSTGYSFASWSVSPSVTISGGKFSMPAGNVTITPVWTHNQYSVSLACSPAAGGSLTANKTLAYYGDAISLTVTANSGYYFSGYTSSGVTVSNNAFYMPANAVSITANFLKRSTATVSSTTCTGGSSIGLTISSESTSYTHKYNLSIGSGMTTGDVSVAAGVSNVTIQIPLNWSGQIPSATERTGGTLTLKTYSGSTLIGTYTVSSAMKYVVPASVVPTVGALTTSVERTIGGTTYANVGNVYVQNKCGVKCTVGACSGAQSSTISSIKVMVGSMGPYTISGTSGYVTSGLLSVSGTLTVTVTVTDSRGRTATRTGTISVLAYSKPRITGFSVWRTNASDVADDFGTYGRYTQSTAISSVGSNAKTVTLTCSGTSQTNPDASGRLMPNSRKTFNILNEYNVVLRVQDSFSEYEEMTIKIQSATFIQHFKADGKGVAFGKVATATPGTGYSQTFEIASGMQVLYGARKPFEEIANLWNLIYPVGSIYMSVNSTNPGTLFGGTWEQIKDRFLLSAGTSYSAGATGGEASHTLSSSEMPSHNHSVGAHAHGLNSHTHSVGAHAHGLNSHTHSVSITTGNNSVGHTHTYTDYYANTTSGSTTLTTNQIPAHSHGPIYKADGTTKVSYANGTAQSGKSFTKFSATDTSGYLGADMKTGNAGGGQGHTHSVSNTSTSRTSEGISANHTHSVSGNTGAASGNTANSTAFNTGAASGNTANSTAFNSGSAGSGSAHNNMPPYLAVYVWKRTA